MALPFAFEHQLAFAPSEAEALLRAIPEAPGVFALHGQDPAAEPYLSRTADLRRRLRRLLAPPEALDANGQPVLSRRLNLRDRIHSIRWTRTGSDFESTLLLYHATSAAFGAAEARRRLRLYTPFFLRVTRKHAHPRAYVTNKLLPRSVAESFGPFPSRAAAERYCDAVLDLFQLRRCYEDLAPYPDHPGCAYGEMNKCLQPCKAEAVCTPASYAAETTRVFDFMSTRGQSLLDAIARDRERASEAMDFEGAAAHHKRWERTRAAALLADELVRPLAALRAVVLQPAAPQQTERADESPAAAVFLLEGGRLSGPARLSTLGVRAVREQTAVGSSLFAQPLMLAAVPLHEPLQTGDVAAKDTDPAAPLRPDDAVGASTTLAPEERARVLLGELAAPTAGPAEPAEFSEFCDALSLFRRWYYRPEKQRSGECFLPNADGSWPIRRILNGAARLALGPPAAAAPVDREAAKQTTRAQKTKIIHAGREGVERIVPVLPRHPTS